jgi:hypothetical protein
MRRPHDGPRDRQHCLGLLDSSSPPQRGANPFLEHERVLCAADCPLARFPRTDPDLIHKRLAGPGRREIFALCLQVIDPARPSVRNSTWQAVLDALKAAASLHMRSFKPQEMGNFFWGLATMGEPPGLLRFRPICLLMLSWETLPGIVGLSRP